ncbi:MAG TPA: DUF397 domain-containing protein [Trebonia sp.]|nr:DUF397 domain-containing protein [Trebonia sp.]
MAESAAVTPRWRKSSFSDNGGSACIEAGQAEGTILVRDTKDNGVGPVLHLTSADWRSFTGRLRTL